MKAIVFDFDGTLADTIPAITAGVNNTLLALGHPVHTQKEVLGFINRGARELVRQALPAEYRADEAYLDRALEIYDQQYGESYRLTSQTYPGLDALVAELHRTYRVGVLSNKQHAFLNVLARRVLPEGSWDAAVGVERGKPAKPDPYLPRKLAALLGVDPADCIMVGDSDVDIMTAKNAGMKHIGVAWGYRSAEFLRAAGAVRIAEDVPALARMIAEIK